MGKWSLAPSSELELDPQSGSDDGTDKIEISEFDVEIDISAFEEPSYNDL